MSEPAAGMPSQDQAEASFRPGKVLRPREQVEGQLREAILAGQFKQGDRLPSEAELARIFAVSRTTVREALRTLAATGLISTTPGAKGGSFVDQRSLAGKLSDSIADTVVLGQFKADELIELLVLLEANCARLAAEQHTEDDLVRLRAIVDGSEVPHSAAHVHAALLSALGAASQRGLLSLLLESLRAVVDALPADSVSADAAAIAGAATGVVDAVEAGDPETAAEAMAAFVSIVHPTRDQSDRSST